MEYNRRLERTLGWDRGELVGRRITAFIQRTGTYLTQERKTCTHAQRLAHIEMETGSGIAPMPTTLTHMLEAYISDIANGTLVLRLIVAAIGLVVMYILGRLASKAIDRHYEALVDRLGERGVNITAVNLMRRIVVLSIYLMGLMFIISLFPSLNSISITLLAGAGFAGIVVGFAAQKVVGNLLSGVAISVFQPFRIGDYVTIQGEYGRVEDVNLQYTIIQTWENKRLVIPNAVISEQTIQNWTIGEPPVYWTVDVGISYDSDIDLARKIMLEETRRHPDVMGYEQLARYRRGLAHGDDEIRVRVIELADSAVVMRVGFWVRDRPTAFATGCDIREAIKKRFDAEGVEIPFPYRTIVYKMPRPEKLKEELGEGGAS